MRNYDNITDLAADFVDGFDNTSGIAEQAYFIPYSWFAEIKQPDAEATTAEGVVTITESHVLKEGKQPISIQPLFEKSGSTTALEGEVLSQIFNTGAEFFLPNVQAKNIGTARAIKNYRGIFLIRRIGQQEGFFQIGDKDIAAYIRNIEGGLGTGPTGEVGLKFTAGAYSLAPYYVYTGELPAPAAGGD